MVVDPDYSSMSGFFGRRSTVAAKAKLPPSSSSSGSKTHLSARYCGHSRGGGGGVVDDDVSIMSIHSTRVWGTNTTTNNNNGSKNKKKKTNDRSGRHASGRFSSAASILSDISSTTGAVGQDDDDDDDDYDDEGIGSLPTTTSTTNGPSHEFLIQCQNGEILFIPSAQGKAIKTRCRHFRYLLGLSISTTMGRGDGGDDASGDASTNKSGRQEYVEERIVQKDNWSIGTARHVLELLTQGTTWIPNDGKRFEALKEACREIDVRLCLGSLINYHDILDQAGTNRFFELSAVHKYQFQFRGVVKSWQWMHLLHRGILLQPSGGGGAESRGTSQILMLTVAPPTDGTTAESLPAAPSTSTTMTTKIVTKLSSSAPNHERLAKCDELCSEFSVYSESGSKIQALLTILDVLSKGRTTAAGTGVSTAINASNKKKKNFLSSPAEEFKLVYKTRMGRIGEEDLNMLWRVTSASYTVATPEEQQYLKRTHRSRTTTNIDETTEDLSNNADHTSMTEESTSSESSSPVGIDAVGQVLPAGYQIRTISGNSFMILRHLFEPINDARNDDSLSKREAALDDLSSFSASLILYNPNPDTLGRFLNAAATANAARTSGSITTEVGWDFIPSSSPPLSSSTSSPNLFFLTDTSEHLKQVLEYLSDYSRSAIVEGVGDFKFNQHHFPRGSGGLYYA